MRLAVVAVLAIYSYRILAPFLQMILWAGIVAVAVHPTFRRFEAALGGRRSLAAVLFTLLMVFVLATPAVLLGSTLVSGAAQIAERLNAGELAIPLPPEGLASWPLVGRTIHKSWLAAHENLAAALEPLRPQLRELAGWAARRCRRRQLRDAEVRGLVDHRGRAARARRGLRPRDPLRADAPGRGARAGVRVPDGGHRAQRGPRRARRGVPPGRARGPRLPRRGPAGGRAVGGAGAAAGDRPGERPSRDPARGGLRVLHGGRAHRVAVPGLEPVRRPPRQRAQAAAAWARSLGADARDLPGGRSAACWPPGSSGSSSARSFW